MNSLHSIITDKVITAARKSFQQCEQILTSKDPRINRNDTFFVLILLGLWLALVVFTETRHEFWRDEIRALSLARQAGSPLDLFGLIQYDGHPILWYLLLYVAYNIFQTQAVLPILAVLIGFAAVTLFMFLARLPLWFKTLFIFSALPFYEYSVMARNYGISMLLMFTVAAIYCQRAQKPYGLALSLALLANTNVYSTVLAGLFGFIWLWDTLAERESTTFKQRVIRVYLPLVIVLLGCLMSAAVVFPKENTILTTANTGISKRLILKTAAMSILRPDTFFEWIVPNTLPVWLIDTLFLLTLIGLIQRPNLFLSAIGAQVAFGVITEFVYEGYYRHEGLYLVFVITLYWMLAETEPLGKPCRYLRFLSQIGLYGAVGVIVFFNVALSTVILPEDWSSPLSSGKAFGELLTQTPELMNAIIIADPDYFMETLPYYAPNQIYFPRESRFGTTVSWTTNSAVSLSMRDLLNVAREIKSSTKQPVLLVLGHLHIDPNTDGSIVFSYNKHFSWTAADMEEFYNSTELIREFVSAISSENYCVYEFVR